MIYYYSFHRKSYFKLTGKISADNNICHSFIACFDTKDLGPTWRDPNLVPHPLHVQHLDIRLYM